MIELQKVSYRTTSDSDVLFILAKEPQDPHIEIAVWKDNSKILSIDNSRHATDALFYVMDELSYLFTKTFETPPLSEILEWIYKGGLLGEPAHELHNRYCK